VLCQDGERRWRTSAWYDFGSSIYAKAERYPAHSRDSQRPRAICTQKRTQPKCGNTLEISSAHYRIQQVAVADNQRMSASKSRDRVEMCANGESVVDPLSVKHK
jgi:hypothetical protein